MKENILKMKMATFYLSASVFVWERERERDNTHFDSSTQLLLDFNWSQSIGTIDGEVYN
jgi:hypothetical protein